MALQACMKRAAIFSAVVMQKHVVQKLEGACLGVPEVGPERMKEAGRWARVWQGLSGRRTQSAPEGTARPWLVGG